MCDPLQALDLEMVGQRQLLQLAGDRLCLQWREVANHRQIDIRLRRMGALRTGSEEYRSDNPRMPAKRVAEEPEFVL